MPADVRQLALCYRCGATKDLLACFAPSQRRKPRPVCKECKGQNNNKFHNIAEDGFDSRKEAARAKYLSALAAGGIIKDLRFQVRYELIPEQRDATGKLVKKAVTYKADFVYIDDRGDLVIEDTKGCRTQAYVIKRKLMLFRLGLRIVEL